MVQVSIAKPTPPRELLGFAGRCCEDQKATPSEQLGIPYALLWGRQRVINEWDEGLWQQDRNISLQVGLLGIFPTSGYATVLLWRAETAPQPL